VPIRRSDGAFYGTLCAIDPEPHRLTPEQADVLRVLARLYATLLERSEEIERRRAAEHALLEADERFRTFLRHSPAPIWLKDDAGRYVFASAAAEAAAPVAGGWTGRTDADLFPAEVAAARRALDARAAAGAAEATEVLPGDDGRPRVFLTAAFPFAAPDGRRYAGGVAVEVTAEHRLQEEARRREARFRALVEHSSDMVAVIGDDGRIRFASPAFERVLGHRPEDLVGRPYADLLHPDEVDRVVAAMASLRASGGGSVAGEARLRAADGGWRWVESVLSNPADEPAVGGVIVNARDVTERKEAERRTAALAAVVDSARLVGFAVDRGGNVSAWNRAAAEHLGIPAAQAVGRRLPRLAPAGEDDPLPSMLARVLRGERTGYAEIRVATPVGEVRDLGVSVAPILGADGAVEGASVIGRDVTEVNRALADRARIAAQERAVLDAAGEAMMLVSPDGTVLVANRAFGGWFGIEPASAVGRPLAALAPVLGRALGDAGFVPAALAAAADPGAEFATGFSQAHPAARELALVSAPVRTDEGDPLGRLFVLRDVSHEREVERAKSEFVSLVSHELRTPLTSIKGFSDLLLEDPTLAGEGEAREFLRIIGANADRLVELVSGMLETSRIESGRVEPEREELPLAPLVEQAVAALRPQLEARNQTASVTAEPGLPPAWADPRLVTQIVTNLLSNANKYTPDGGRIAVRLERDGSMLRCAVTDTGIGMSADELEQVFTRFFRARNQTTMATRGTGLGLSITRSLVELHGGRVSVESEPAVGSTFAFTLPIAAEVRAPEADRTAPAPGDGVLVVEDDPDTARLVRRRLEAAGHRVLVAATGADALALAEAERPALILLDLVLPDLDGLDVLEHLKADPALAAIPVLVHSATDDDGAGRRLGAVGHLAKPVAEAALLDQVAALVRPGAGAVLVADDEAAVRRLVATMLRRGGYRVLEAADGAEAVDLALREQPALALLDIRMPRMTGIEALHALRGDPATRRVPVVMMTAHAAAASDARGALAAADPGFAALLSKPFSLDDLLAAVERALATAA
jgi:PAS domain S-box-containing protein